MIKKTLTTAEVNFIYLNANDIVCGSPMSTSLDTNYYENDQTLAPSRFNYRGAEMGYEDNEW